MDDFVDFLMSCTYAILKALFILCIAIIVGTGIALILNDLGVF